MKIQDVFSIIMVTLTLILTLIFGCIAFGGMYWVLYETITSGADASNNQVIGTVGSLIMFMRLKQSFDNPQPPTS
jgi:hypothetical protein